MSDRRSSPRGPAGTLSDAAHGCRRGRRTQDLRLVNAAKDQDLQQVRTLLSGHPDVNIRSEDGSTALLWAAHWNDLQMGTLLVRAGADANAANDFKMTPLAQACTNGNAEFVDLLLKAGANPNTPIGTGETPLMTCARTGSSDAVRMLLVRGADANAKEPNQNQTALMWAAAQQHPKVLQILTEAGADLRAHTNQDLLRCTLPRASATWSRFARCWTPAST